jgi:hypothetical protein
MTRHGFIVVLPAWPAGTRGGSGTPARADAMFFVDDREPYRQADEARFWE